MSQCRHELRNNNASIYYCKLEAGHQGEHSYAGGTDTTRWAHDAAAWKARAEAAEAKLEEMTERWNAAADYNGKMDDVAMEALARAKAAEARVKALEGALAEVDTWFSVMYPDLPLRDEVRAALAGRNG